MLMKKAKAKILLIGILVIIGLGFIIAKSIKPKKPKEEVVAPKLVQTAIAIQSDVPIFIESFGNLNPASDVDVRAQVTGEIQGVHFEEGQRVKKGDLLFTINPSSYKAEYEKAQAALDADIADLNLKKDILQRNQKLYEGDLISKQDYIKYQSDVEAAQAKIRVDQSQLELAKINLDYCSITSPIDGITSKRQIDVGNIVTADTGPVLVNIKAIDELYVDFSISESELQKVRDAMSQAKLVVEISSQTDPKDVFSGEIELLENVVDTTTGTISLRAIVQNEEKKLWAGQFVKVRLILGKEKDAILVPYSAVELGQQGSYLFVVNPDNKAELRNVTTGEQHGDNIIIEEGVKVGEKVVTSGQMGLSTGVTVQEAKEQ